MKTRAFKHRGNVVVRRRRARMCRLINLMTAFNSIFADLKFIAAPQPLPILPVGATTVYIGRRPMTLIQRFKENS